MSMALRLFNTDGKKKQDFIPISAGKALVYTCGPTVYHYAHIGNLRAYVFSDTLRRVLALSGYEVTHIVNITDVGHLTGDGDDGEDKMLKGAAREGKTVWEIAQYYTDAFMKHFTALRCLQPSRFTKATEHIQDMIAMIQDIERNGYTYVADGNVYLDTTKVPDYGRLFGLDQSREEQSRVEVDSAKKNQRDFVLWFTKSKFQDQEMKWDSPWGTGYPGWHIECSAMSSKYLGNHFDIHTGGMDHITIHHTNEIAQSECAFGTCGESKWVNYWLHNEFLVMDGKMSKSSGEFLTLQSLLDKGYTPEDYRYFLLLTHYRKSISFSYSALDAAKQAVDKLKNRVMLLLEDGASNVTVSGEYVDRFRSALEDDLNTAEGIAVVWNVVGDDTLDASTKYSLLMHFDTVLGLGLDEISLTSIPDDVMELVRAREDARLAKDWERSDALRDDIADKGYTVTDSSDGPVVRKR